MDDMTRLGAAWGPLAQAPRLIAERENRVYAVAFKDGRRGALRVHRKGYHTEPSIRAELSWMHHFAGRDLPVPSPMTTLTGDHVAPFNGSLASCVTWIEAPSLAEPSAQDNSLPQTFERLGLLLARLHQAARDLDVPAGRHRWDLAGLLGDTPTWGRFWENPSLSQDEAAKLQAARRRASDWLTRFEPSCVIHADLLSENILVDNGALWIIDFDDAGFGYPGYDLGTALVQYHSHPDLMIFAEALCAGYGNVDAEDAIRFMALRAFASAGWCMSRLAHNDLRQRTYAKRALSQTDKF